MDYTIQGRSRLKAHILILLGASLLALCLSCESVQAPQAIDRQFTAKPVFGDWLFSVTPNIQSFCFFLYIPDDYASTQSSFPLLLFLPGWGNFGYTPNPALLSAGPLLPLYVSDTRLDPGGLAAIDPKIRQSIVIIPMLPFYDGTYQNPLGWYDPQTLNRIIDYVTTLYQVDPKRFYVTGLSEGGGGSWGYAARYPEKVTALIPISCGLSWPATSALRAIPTWIFHSFDDTFVPHRTTSDAAFNQLTGVPDVLAAYPHSNGNPANSAAGDFSISWDSISGLGSWTPGAVFPSGLIAYTMYASGGHDAWTRSYANPDVWNWLYAQTK